MKYLFILSISLVLIGCAEQSITIRSRPEGAKVLVDSQEMGVTPCTFHFTYYGTREIVLEKEGYETMQTVVSIRPSLFNIFPLDILTIFFPYPLADERSFSYTLKPFRPQEIEEIVKRGEELKSYLNKKIER